MPVPVIRVNIIKGKSAWGKDVNAAVLFTDDAELADLLRTVLPPHGYSVRIKQLPMHEELDQ